MSSRICLFCPKPIGPKTSPEHILLDALGGRATTRRVICTACNNRFGSSIDRVFTGQIEPLRTILNLQSGSKKAPPPHRYKSQAGDTYTLHPDGNVSGKTKPLAFGEKTDGKVDVQLTVSTLDEINKFIPHIASKTGASEDQIRHQIAAGDARQVSTAAPSFNAELSFGGHDALRSMVKSCLVLCAVKTDLKSIAADNFAEARNFVINGGEDFLNDRIKLEGRDIPGIDKIIKEFGPIFNFIFCKSDQAGRMTAYYGLYNTAYWNIVLAETGAPPDKAFGVVSDPRDAGKWRHFGSSFFDLDNSWMFNPILGAGDRIQKSLEIAFSERGEVQRNQYLEQIFRETMLECNVKLGEQITQEFINKFSARVALWWMRLTHEAKVSPEQLRAAVRPRK